MMSSHLPFQFMSLDDFFCHGLKAAHTNICHSQIRCCSNECSKCMSYVYLNMTNMSALVLCKTRICLKLNRGHVSGLLEMLSQTNRQWVVNQKTNKRSRSDL